MAQSISDSIATLYTFLVEAKASAESNKPARSLRDALARASTALRDWVDVTPEATALAYFTDTAVNALNVSADGYDKSAADAAARRVEGILMADLVEDPFSVTDVQALLNEYRSVTASSKPRGSRSGSSSVPDLGFTVKVKDEKTGDIVGSTTKDNLNSLRDQVRKHHEKSHGSKPSKGEPVWQGVTDALEAVMHKGTQSAQGGGYLVDKAA